MGSSAQNHPVFVLGSSLYGFVSTKLPRFCSREFALWIRQHKNAPFCADETLYELNWWNCRQIDDACLNRFLNFRIFVGSPDHSRVIRAAADAI